VSGVYSLWLVPNRETKAYRRLSETIGELAAAHPDAPEFEPHVTVLGGIRGDQDRITKRAQHLAEERRPLELTFTTLQCSTTKHQCVFLLVQPTRELLSVHQAAVQRFDTDGGMYVPHLSLIYSDMSIDDRFTVVESIGIGSLPGGVDADELAVIETTGSVPEWHTVATHEL
jgi:2'-5' RNA ligase